MTPHTFTEYDFAEYEAAVLHWLDAFGITDWHVTITHDQIGRGINAQTQYNTTAKNVSFRLTHNTEGDYGMLTDPKRLALHEVLHLLLAEYCETTAKLGDPVHDLVIAQEHGVLNKLMRVLK